MFKNYFISAIRNIRRFKLFTFLNVFGLAGGIACSVLIMLWVQDEYSYDKFNKHAESIYRLVVKIDATDAAVTPVPMPDAFKQLPAIKNYARLSTLEAVVSVGIQKINEKGLYYADPSFLKLFNYPLLQGDAQSVLARPDAAVLTVSTAKKYFGTTNVIGKILHIGDDIHGNSYQVTGLMKDVPHNSHLQFNILLPFTAFEHSSNYSYDNGRAWGSFDVYTYIQTSESFNATQASLNALAKKIADIRYANDPDHTRADISLQPLTDIHLKSHYLLDVDGQGNVLYVRIFSIVAAFILLIACINFMNLSTAIARQRAKEVGLRKTIGAQRFQLVAQFLTEYLFVAVIAMCIGVVAAYLLLPVFNELSSKNISFNILDLRTFLGLLAIAVMVGLASGSYPAFYLASFNPIKVFKGIKTGSQKAFFRNGLVIVQFSISVVLMISTLVVNSQLRFIRNRDIGFNKENLMYLQMPRTGDLQSNYQALKNTLLQNVRTSNYTIIEHLPTSLTTGTLDVKWTGKDPEKQILFPGIGVDGNFIRTFGIHLIAGRMFDENNDADKQNFVVNETTLRIMNFKPQNAIGQKITMNGHTGEIIGVVKDFNFKPVQQTIEPLILWYTKRGGFVVIKTSPAGMQQLIVKLKDIFQQVYPNAPFAYGFVDQDLAHLYIAEQRMAKLFNVFSVISIIISCLGLFGLATFATQQRVKEIGVRRTLGASPQRIVVLLAKDFVKLVAAALLVAFPLGWAIMSKWLQNYAYRISLSWWVFAVSGLAAIAIAVLTISYQSIKAAYTNPVESLRNNE